MRRLRVSLAVLLLLGACEAGRSSVAVSPAEGRGAARDSTGRTSAEPWLVIEIPAPELSSLVGYTNTVSGYLKVVVAEADPPFVETQAIQWIGNMNPVGRMIDVDLDGNPDAAGDIDTFGIQSQAMGEIPDAGFHPGEANRGVTVRAGVVGFDMLGRVFVTQWAPEPVTLDGETPAFVRLPPLPAPTAASPCQDAVDDDGDGWIDVQDPDCRPGGPLVEAGVGTSPCNDGIDNDDDGLADRQDPGCEHADDISELPSCQDGMDDDGDGWVDSADPDCAPPGSGEHGFGASGCNDGLDGDHDGWVDHLDSDCAAGATATE